MTLLTPDEAAAILKASRSKVYALCRANKLPHIRVGGSVRIIEEKLLAMLDAESMQMVIPIGQRRRYVPKIVRV